MSIMNRFFVVCSVGLFLATCVEPKNIPSRKSRINAKEYDGFQALEAALIPVGSYLQISDLPYSPTTIVKPINDVVDADEEDDSAGLSGLINSVIAAETSQSANQKQRAAHQEAAKRWLAGIVPLRATRLPMGIFIPEQEEGGRMSSMKAIRAKVAAGVKRVFQKLRRLAKKRESFNYVRTFNGLSPLEAVFIPRGYFIPLTSVSSYIGGSTNITTNGSGKASVKYVAGIQPLDSVLLPGGVFIPRSMSSLPILPSQMLLPAVTNQSAGGAVSTVAPDIDSEIIPSEPDFPETATSSSGTGTSTASNQAIVSTVNPLNCIPGPNVVPGCPSPSPPVPMKPSTAKPVDEATKPGSITVLPDLAKFNSTATPSQGEVTINEDEWENEEETVDPNDSTPPPLPPVVTGTTKRPIGPVGPPTPINLSLMLPAGTPIERNPAVVDVNYDPYEISS